MSRAVQLPSKVYVQWAVDRDKSRWLMAAETQDEALDQDLCGAQAGERVGVYRLEKVVKLTRGPITERPA